MTTTAFNATVRSSDAATIVLRISPISPLFLSQLSVDLNSAVSSFAGRVQPGTLAHPGVRTIQASTQDFNRLSGECVPNTTVSVSITYDAQFNVSAMDCAPLQQAKTA